MVILSRSIKLKALLLLVVVTMTTGCSIKFLVKSGYYQSKILLSREPIKEILTDGKYDEKLRKKLKLVLEVKDFAEKDLGLKKTDNYLSYVQLEDPNVSYILRVSDKYQLKTYRWSYPFFGSFPYIGYFKKQDALDEQKKFDKKGYDTYIRGASAYSTLGWFDDPVLSSMTNYSDHYLVNTIIHETVHATIFIKSNIEFNEQLATFLGDKGMELYYLKKDGANSPHLLRAKLENHDQQLFSKFISKEIDQLKKWYKKHENKVTEETKAKRLRQIQASFVLEVKPHLKTRMYSKFAQLKLNNASLLPYATYMKNLDKFDLKFKEYGSDYKKFLEYCKTLKEPF